MSIRINKIFLVAAAAFTGAASIQAVTTPNDYTQGNAIWFDVPNSSTNGVAIWNIDNGHAESTNPDPVWERFSLPIGNGSFGGNVIGSVNRERIVLN